MLRYHEKNKCVGKIVRNAGHLLVFAQCVRDCERDCPAECGTVGNYAYVYVYVCVHVYLYVYV